MNAMQSVADVGAMFRKEVVGRGVGVAVGVERAWWECGSGGGSDGSGDGVAVSESVYAGKLNKAQGTRHNAAPLTSTAHRPGCGEWWVEAARRVARRAGAERCVCVCVCA